MTETPITDAQPSFADPGMGSDTHGANAAVHKAAIAAGLASYVQDGLEFTPDWANGVVDISPGVAVLELPDSFDAATQSYARGPYDDPWYGPVAIPFNIPEVTGVGFTADAVNDVWIDLVHDNTNGEWDLSYQVGPNAAGDVSHGIKIGEIDDTGETTDTTNRVPDITGFAGQLDEPQEPQHHGNNYHDEEYTTQSTLDAHATSASGVHGVGDSSVASRSYVNSEVDDLEANVNSQLDAKADDPHGDYAHSIDYAKATDLADKADDPHGDAAHAEDYAKTGDLDGKADNPHDNTAHSVDYATPTDLDGKADDPHGNAAHSEDYLPQSGGSISNDLDVTGSVTAGAATVSGPISADSNITAGGDIDVGGNILFSTLMDVVDDDTNFTALAFDGSSLTINSDTTLTSPLILDAQTELQAGGRRVLKVTSSDVTTVYTNGSGFTVTDDSGGGGIATLDSGGSTVDTDLTINGTVSANSYDGIDSTDGAAPWASPNHSTEFAELVAGETLTLPVPVSPGETLTLYSWGALSTDDTTPSGLDLEFADPSGTVLTSNSTSKQTNENGIESYANSGSTTEVCRLRVVNNTGSDFANGDGVSWFAGFDVE